MRTRTSDAILDAAQALFRERGYSGATINAIAARGEVALGTLYAGFGSKEGVYLALVERALETNERYLDDAYGAAQTPREEVLAAGEAYLRFHIDNPLALRLLGMRDLDDPDARAAVAARLDAMIDRLAEALERAVEAGEIRAIHPRRAATFLWAAWNGVITLNAQGRLSRKDLRATIDTGLSIIEAGLDP